MTDDQRRLLDVLTAIEDAHLIVEGGRAAFEADPLVVRAAKNIVTEIGDTLEFDLPELEQRIRTHLDHHGDEQV